MTAVPGWYPDPIGDHEERWWDGSVWTDQVRTGRHVGRSPVAHVPIPPQETTLWAYGKHWLSTHAAYVDEGRGVVQHPWWSVSRLYVQVPVGRALAGTGDVVLVIDYPGYYGRHEYRMKSVPDADAVAALGFTWSRRHRRAAGYT